MEGLKLSNVTLRKDKRLRGWLGIQVVLVFTWMLLLWDADKLAYSVDEVAYPMVYNFCGLLSLACMLKDFRTGVSRKTRTQSLLLVIAVCFSIAVCMANYPLFEPVHAISSWVQFAALMAGGTVVFWHILKYAANQFPQKVTAAGRNHPNRFFLSCFILSSVVYLSYLFCVAFPGYYLEDMVMGFEDIVDGSYNRIIPIWHTLFVELCLNIGYLFGWEGNSALAVYTVIQAVAFAAVCSYALVTLYEMGIPRWCIFVCFFVYVLFPYNIIYSVKIWKDIPFSLGSFAMAVSLYRIVRKMGNISGNYAVFAAGGFVFCLSRTNGWYSFLAVMALLTLLLHKHQKNSFWLDLCFVQ